MELNPIAITILKNGKNKELSRVQQIFLERFAISLILKIYFVYNNKIV